MSIVQALITERKNVTVFGDVAKQQSQQCLLYHTAFSAKTEIKLGKVTN